MRKYPSENVDEKSLDKILLAGCAAPINMGKYGSMHLTVIQSRDILDRIIMLSNEKFGFNLLHGASVFIIVSSCGDETFDNIEYVNATCIIENMCLASTDEELGSTFLWGIITAIVEDDDLLKELKIPEGFRPIAGMITGHSAENVPKKELEFLIECNMIM